jgi:Signal transduction histidine kinase
MHLFQSRQLLAYLFVILAIIIALASLLLSNRLVKELAEEERGKLEVWALATQSVASGDENVDMSLVLKILQSNTTIPVILHDEGTGELLGHNIKPSKKEEHAFLLKKMEAFGRKHPPIELKELSQSLYYDDSNTLKQLRAYPYIQLFVMALFTGLAFFALNRSQRAEQNKVWVGLSKETAHQLGTPISSLMAWTEYLRLKETSPQLLTEMDKDIARLQMITERFSKIGSISDLKTTDLRDVVRGSLAYLEKRVSNKVTFDLAFPERPVSVSLNEPLFGWVIENLTKNAVDAMNGQGTVTFSIGEKGKQVILDISDTGRGLPKSKFRRVFSPGYTTKERGWGLGLSLVKRIVETYHKGTIVVKKSEIGKGTTFRIVLRTAKESVL